MHCSNSRFHSALNVRPARGVGPIGPYAGNLVVSETAATAVGRLRVERVKASRPHGRRSLRQSEQVAILESAWLPVRSRCCRRITRRHPTSQSSRDPAPAGYQQVTRNWRRGAANSFDLVASVVLEAGAGDAEAARFRLANLDEEVLLEASADAARPTEGFLEQGAVPRKAAEDAAHTASFRTAGQVQTAYTMGHKHVSLLSKDWP